jgi:uncharacterized protein (UPF0548 family)
MWRFTQPTAAELATFLTQQALLEHSYREIGQSGEPEFPTGYDHDRNQVYLGQGEATFSRGCAALQRWAMFPGPWTRIEPQSAPQVTGTVVAMLARSYGLWWMNAARIVYTVDQHSGAPGVPQEVKRRQGFAYGTLPGHVECGEERFTIVWRLDDSVWYELQAFSKPRYWMVRWAKPLARTLQRRFVRESLALMQEAAR